MTLAHWLEKPAYVLSVMASFLAVATMAMLITLTPANAVQPNEILDDPALEARARELSANLRCLVCQNQSIDDSDAPLARDLRLIVRERLVKGDTNDEVISFLVERYGDFVLLKPPIAMRTILLWIAPLLLLGLAGALIIRYLAVARSGDHFAAATTEEMLSETEQAKLAELLKKEPGEKT